MTRASGDRLTDPIMLAGMSLMGLGLPLLALGRIPLFVALGGGIVLATIAMLRRDARGLFAAMIARPLIPLLGAAVFVSLLASAFLSHRPAVTLLKVGDLAALFVLLWLAMAIVSRCSPREAWALVLAFTLGMVAALFHSLGDATACTYNEHIDDLYKWCVKRGRHRGTAFAVMFPVMVGLVLHWRDRRGLSAWWGTGLVLIGLMALAVFLSNGRTAWGTLFAGLVFLSALGIAHGHLRRLWQVWIASGLAFGGWYLITISFQARVLVSRGDVTSGDYGAFNGRETSWTEALRLWQENPVLGVGVWNYRDLIDHFNHPHGFLPELLSDTGTVGTVLVLTILVVLALRLWRGGAAGPLTAGCAAAFASYFVAASAATSIFYGWWLCVLFGVLILGAAARRIEAADDETPA